MSNIASQLQNSLPQQNRPFGPFCRPAAKSYSLEYVLGGGVRVALRPRQTDPKSSIFLGRGVLQLALASVSESAWQTIIDRYPKASLRILLSGSSGFIGSHFKLFLKIAGHEVVPLVRKRKDLTENTIFWDPIHGFVQKEDFEGFDAVIHLAGAGIATGRWTKHKKEQLFLSRCRDTVAFTAPLPTTSPSKNTLMRISSGVLWRSKGRRIDRR